MNLIIPDKNDIPNYKAITFLFSVLPFNNLRLKVIYINTTDEVYMSPNDTNTVSYTFFVYDMDDKLVTQITKTFDFNNDNVYLKDLFSEQYLNQDGTFNFNDYYFLVSSVSDSGLLLGL